MHTDQVKDLSDQEKENVNGVQGANLNADKRHIRCIQWSAGPQ